KTSERVKTQSERQQQQLKATQGNAEKLAEQNQTLRIEVAALKERAAHAETLKALIEKLQSELVDLARGKGADQKGGNEKDIERSAPKQQQNPKQPEIAPRETPKATQKTEEEKPVAQKKTEPQTPLRGLSAPSAPRETAKPEIVKPGIVKPEIVKK
ncbi:MAG: hypothetical protein KJP07_21190, partial [Desulfatitalea sp.]|nr:hypothetical protein [Desulfatitalea sp.]NNJ84165.1 hypothetical protein [Gammaproteobacteria bacterium]